MKKTSPNKKGGATSKSFNSLAIKSRGTSNLNKTMKTFQQRDNRYNSQTKKQLPVVQSVKGLGLIHAYKPHMLQNVLMTDPKVYTQYYNKHGDCQMNIYLKSVLLHLRNWSQKIKNRVYDVFQLMMETNELNVEEIEGKVSKMLKQVKQINNQLKKTLESLSQKRGIEQSKISNLKKRYENLDHYITHIQHLINCFFQFHKEVNSYLAKQEDINIDDQTQIQQSISRIIRKYERIIGDSMTHCSCHSDNEIFRVLQFKIKEKFGITKKSVLKLFEEMKNLQQFEINFRKRIIQLHKMEDLTSIQNLQKILQFLYLKNQELKLGQKKFGINQKMKDKVYNLRSQIQDLETKFIAKLKLKNTILFEDFLNKLNSIRYLALAKDKGKSMVHIKKKWLLIVKVLDQSQKESGINEEIYHQQKTETKQIILVMKQGLEKISPQIQSLNNLTSETLSFFQKRSQDENLRQYYSVLNKIKKVQSIQQEIWKTTFNIYEKLSMLEKKKIKKFTENNYEDSEKVEQFLNLVEYSRRQKQNNQIYKVAENFYKLKYKRVKKQEINQCIKKYQQLTKSINKYFFEDMEEGILKSEEMSKLKTDELISFTFCNKFEDEFICFYSLISLAAKTFHNLLIKQTEFVYLSHRKFYLCGASAFQSFREQINKIIKKSTKSEFKQTFNQLLVLFYECKSIELMNLKFLCEKCLEKENSQKVNAVSQNEERAVVNKTISNFTHIYEVAYLNKTISRQTSFTTMLSQIYQSAKTYSSKEILTSQFLCSCFTNSYFPSISFLQQIIQTQFSFHIQMQIDQQQYSFLKKQQEGVIQAQIKRCENLKNKMKMEKNKQYYKQIYQEVSKTIELLNQLLKNKQYRDFMKVFLNFLRTKQINHNGFYTNQNEPLYCLFKQNKDTATYLLSLINKRSTKTTLLNYFQLIDIHKLEKPIPLLISHLMVSQIGKKVENIVVEKKPKPQIHDSIIDEAIEDLAIDSQIGDSIVFFQNIDQVHEEKEINEVTNEKKEDKQQQKTKYSYYKIKKIKNLATLKQCFSNENTQFDRIKKMLNLQILLGTLKNEKNSIAIKHFSDILDQLASKNLSIILEFENIGTQPQQYIIDLKKKLENNEKINNFILAEMLEYYQFQKVTVFEEGDSFIHLIKGQSEDVYYPFYCLQHSIPHTTIEQLQISSIVQQILSSANKKQKIGVDNINRSIQNCNFKLTAFYEQQQLKIKGYKKWNTQSEKQVDLAVDHFLKKKIQKGKILQIFSQENSNLKRIDQIDKIIKECKQIKIIKQFKTLDFDNKFIFASTQDISLKMVFSLIGVSKVTSEVQSTLIVKQGSIKMPTQKVVSGFQDKAKKSEKITLNKVCQLINKKIPVNFKQICTQKQNVLSFFQNYFQFIQFANLQNLRKLHLEIQAELQLLKLLKRQQDTGIQQKVQTCSIFDFRCSDQVIVKQNKQPNLDLIEKVQKLLAKAMIHYVKVMKSNICLGFIEDNQNISIANFFNMKLSQFEVISQNFIIKDSEIEVKRLNIKIKEILPSLKEQDNLLFKEEWEKQLSHSYFTVHGGQTKSYVMSQLQDINFVQVETSYPKGQLSMVFQSKEFKIQQRLERNDYQHFKQYFWVKLSDYLLEKKEGLSNLYKEKERIQLETYQDNKKKTEQNKLDHTIRIYQKQISIIKLEEQKLRLIDSKISRLEKTEKISQIAYPSLSIGDKSKKNENIYPSIHIGEKSKIKKIEQNDSESEGNISYLLSEGWEAEFRVNEKLPQVKLQERKQNQNNVDIDLTLSEGVMDKQQLHRNPNSVFYVTSSIKNKPHFYNSGL